MVSTSKSSPAAPRPITSAHSHLTLTLTVSRKHCSPSRRTYCRRRHHGLHPHRVHSLHRRRRNCRSAVHPRRPAHPEPQSLRRRVCASCLHCSCWQLHPPRDQVWQAAADWIELTGYVWTVHFRYGLAEGKRKGLRARISQSYGVGLVICTLRTSSTQKYNEVEYLHFTFFGLDGCTLISIHPTQLELFSNRLAQPSDPLINLFSRCGCVCRSEEQCVMILISICVEPASPHDQSSMIDHL